MVKVLWINIASCRLSSMCTNEGISPHILEQLLCRAINVCYLLYYTITCIHIYWYAFAGSLSSTNSYREVAKALYKNAFLAAAKYLSTIFITKM